MLLEKNCLMCGKLFGPKSKDGPSRWSERKFCSNRCSWDSNIGKKSPLRIRQTNICRYCGLPFETGGRRGPLDQKFCSVKCNNINRNKSGILGRKIDGSGYYSVYRPKHIKANRGYVTEHRLVAEAVLGRTLKEDEMVHHLDCNRKNNNPENLFVCTKSIHQLLHAKMSESYARHVFGGQPLEMPDFSDGVLLSTLPIPDDLSDRIKPDIIDNTLTINDGG